MKKKLEKYLIFFFKLKKFKKKIEKGNLKKNEKIMKKKYHSSAFHSDQMSEGSQVLKVTIFIKISKVTKTRVGIMLSGQLKCDTFRSK